MPIFDPASLHAAIDHSLQASNLGKDKNAFLIVATGDGVKAVLSTKIGQKWTISQMISIDHEKHIEGGLEVIKTW